MPARAGERIIHFLRHQAGDIRRGGFPALLRKARELLVRALAMTVILAVRALRPLVLIRFGQLVSGRIGHFAGDTELYLCRRDAGMDSPRTFDVFYHGSSACNQQLKKMWDRTLHVSRLAGPVDRINHWLPGGEKHVIPWYVDRDIHGLLPRTRVHLRFTPEEERRGVAALRELGIPDSTSFICFHSRHSAYLQNMFPHSEWHYHDYRDSDIHNHVPAVEEMTRRGYFTVRMGAVVKEPLQTTNPMIIDYAIKSRTEFLDIFLGAKCHFYLGDPCGLHAIPMVFRRPLALVNMVPLEYAPTWSLNGLFIPKKLWRREEHRFLTFGETFDTGASRFLSSELYEQLGVDVMENTAEEITALAVEMDERLKGTWQTTEEDEELQRRFWSLFKPSELNGVFLLRLGAEFLRQNRDLLD
jgi:putative glycosyltransferase (TIGR04372 family)